MKRLFNCHFGTWKCWKGFITSYYFQWYWVVYFRNTKSYYRLVSPLLLFWFSQKQQVSVYMICPSTIVSLCTKYLPPLATACYWLFLTYFVTTFNWCPWKINCREAILVSLQECWNLAVSSCTGTLITKGKELNSKLGLCSFRHN